MINSLLKLIGFILYISVLITMWTLGLSGIEIFVEISKINLWLSVPMYIALGVVIGMISEVIYKKLDLSDKPNDKNIKLSEWDLRNIARECYTEGRDSTGFPITTSVDRINSIIKPYLKK